MKFQAQVKTNSKKESIEKAEDGSFVVRVNVPPVDGKANKKVIEILAKYFNVPKSHIELVSGQKSKRKTFQIL